MDARNEAGMRRHAVRLADSILREGVETPLPVIPGYVRRKCVTVLVAEGGSGKSLLVNQWGWDVGTGDSFLGIEVSKGAALIFDNEMPADGLDGPEGRNAGFFRGRDYSTADTYTVNLFDEAVDDPDNRLSVDVKIDENKGKIITLDSFEKRLSEELELLGEVGKRVSMVVIDGVTEFLDGRVEENVAADVRKVVSAFRRLAAQFNVGIVLRLHTAKGKPRETKDAGRGSSAWHDAPDYHVVLKKDSERGTEVSAKLEVGKARWDAKPPTRLMERNGLEFWHECPEPAKGSKALDTQGAKAAGRRSGYSAEAILGAFRGGKAEITQADLARELGVEARTARRYAEQAITENVIERMPNGKLRLTRNEDENEDEAE